VLNPFAATAREQCEVLEGMHKKMMSLFQQTAKYYCFDPKKYTMEDFFGDIKAFMDNFNVRYFLLWPLNSFSMTLSYAV